MKDCLFCKIINNEIPSKKIFDNDYVLAFLDINPISAGHILLIPKKHYDNLSTCDELYLKEIIKATKEIANKLIDLNIGINGFNYLSNENKIAGQIINHFHLHIIPKYNENQGLIISTNDDKTNIDNNKLKKIMSLIIK